MAQLEQLRSEAGASGHALERQGQWHACAVCGKRARIGRWVLLLQQGISLGPAALSPGPAAWLARLCMCPDRPAVLRH